MENSGAIMNCGSDVLCAACGCNVCAVQIIALKAIFAITIVLRTCETDVVYKGIKGAYEWDQGCRMYAPLIPF